jgi:beta-N-acetylhexosaminidase
VLFTALDETQPATLSPQVINSVIRGAIGFAGLLMTDDISMRALGGSIAKRCRQAQTAGCDVILHCNGILAEMVKVAENTGTLRGEALNRARKVLDWLAVAGDQAEESPASMRAEWAALIKEVA